MKVHRELESFNVKTPVVTIGIFDGVHQGHYKIINRLQETAKRIKGESVIFTLWPHPRIVLDPESNRILLINTLEEKISLLKKTGVDHLIIHPFDRKFASITACDFIEKYLVKKIGVKHLIIGFNHQFGHKRKGDYNEYENCANQFDFKIEKLGRKEINGVNISSTAIRKAILKGDILLANNYLGYKFSISGRIAKGLGLGKTIGYPTANIILDNKNKIIPADGVYAVKVSVKDNIYNAMLNIGKNPTIGQENPRTIEVNIFNFNEDIYNCSIEVFFHQRIRDEIKLNNLKELQALLREYKQTVLKMLNSSD